MPCFSGLSDSFQRSRATAQWSVHPRVLSGPLSLALSLGALTALTVPNARADDSTLTLYGVLDAAVGTVQHSPSVSDTYQTSVNVPPPIKSTLPSQDSVNGMFNGATQNSRWGIRGKESLSEDLSAIFTLESGINLPTGQLNNGAASLAGNDYYKTSTGQVIGPNSSVSSNSSLSGQLFGREAFVGLSDRTLGTLTFGRQYQTMYDIFLTYDPVQRAPLFSPLAGSGSYGGGIGISDEQRVDNSIKYDGHVGAVNVGGLVKLGGIAGHNGARSDWAVRLGYEDGSFGVAAAYERITDGIKGASCAASGSTACLAPALSSSELAVTNYNALGYLLAARYKVDAATFKAGFERYTLSRPSDPFASLNVTSYFGYAVGNPGTADFKGADQSTEVFWFGGVYQFTPKVNLAAAYFDVRLLRSADAVDGNRTVAPSGQFDGDQHYYSLLAQYSLSRRTTLYAGGMLQRVSGEQFTNVNKGSTSYLTYPSNRVLALGLRHTF